jgi:hypothetical protein
MKNCLLLVGASIRGVIAKRDNISYLKITKIIFSGTNRANIRLLSKDSRSL